MIVNNAGGRNWDLPVSGPLNYLHHRRLRTKYARFIHKDVNVILDRDSPEQFSVWDAACVSAVCTSCTCVLLLLLSTGLPAAAQTPAGRIDGLLQRYHADQLFNGSVLVADGGTVIYEAGFGEADMSWHVPNTPDTKFRIGSATKQLTAALILTLVEDSLIGLDGKITDYLPDYPRPQGDRITIHQLLSHTSGIPSYTNLPGFMSNEIRDPFAVDSLVALFSSLDLEFDPGSRWAYSNSGYIVLGAIVEAVTGKRYGDALSERVLKVLGLNDTGYERNSDVLERQASGYYRLGSVYHRAPYLDTSVPFSAGMLYSTVRDLYKWDQSLYGNGPFRKPETKTLMLTAHATLPPDLVQEARLPQSYGYGWFVGDVYAGPNTIRVVEHGGSIFGFATLFWRMPKERKTIILLDNTFSRSLREIGTEIMAILYE